MQPVDHDLGRFFVVEAFRVALAVSVDAQGERPRARLVARQVFVVPPAADVESVGILAPVVIDQHREIVLGMGFDIHLRGAQGRARVADDSVRHGTDAFVVAIEVCSKVLRGTDEADRAAELRHAAPDRGAVRREQREVVSRRVPRVHVDERNLLQVHRHLVGVVRGDARDADALQYERLELDQGRERAGVREERLLVWHERSLLVQARDPQRLCLRGIVAAQDIDRGVDGADHAAAQEHAVGDRPVAELLDDLPRFAEVCRDLLKYLSVRRLRYSSFSAGSDSTGLFIAQPPLQETILAASPANMAKRSGAC